MAWLSPDCRCSRCGSRASPGRLYQRKGPPAVRALGVAACLRVAQNGVRKTRPVNGPSVQASAGVSIRTGRVSRVRRDCATTCPSTVLGLDRLLLRVYRQRCVAQTASRGLVASAANDLCPELCPRIGRSNLMYLVEEWLNLRIPESLRLVSSDLPCRRSRVSSPFIRSSKTRLNWRVSRLRLES